jgi:hypothetical protein
MNLGISVMQKGALGETEGQRAGILSLIFKTKPEENCESITARQADEIELSRRMQSKV